MHTRTTTTRSARRVLPLLLSGILTIGAAACGDEPAADDDASTASTPAAEETTEPETADTVASEPETGGADQTAPAAGPLPVASALVLRDQLLAAAATADYTVGSKEQAIFVAWDTAFPGLQRSLLPDQPADATTVSVSSAFLLTPLTSDGDQAYGFAVLDSSGSCAGGVVVVPGNADGSVNDIPPTQFAPVDGLTDCSADGAIAALQALAG